MTHWPWTCQGYNDNNNPKKWNTYLNAKGKSLGETQDDYLHNFGAPERLTWDGLQYQVSKDKNFFNNSCKYNIDRHVSAPQHPNENPAQGDIREIKRRFS